ncbi:MAG: hypothetical protein JXR36_07510 [Bacteroidales bacterium]|nr:hypothetical protein [Bacteroidales bacterium]
MNITTSFNFILLLIHFILWSKQQTLLGSFVELMIGIGFLEIMSYEKNRILKMFLFKPHETVLQWFRQHNKAVFEGIEVEGVLAYYLSIEL